MIGPANSEPSEAAQSAGLVRKSSHDCRCQVQRVCAKGRCRQARPTQSSGNGRRSRSPWAN
eukprot:4707066-Alexandrium_andersonii.AAC.1